MFTMQTASMLRHPIRFDTTALRAHVRHATWAAVALALGASGAFGATLKVDDDGVQCGAQAFTTIQAAVDAASAGDTIKVCPGTYAEKVTVTKTVKLKGKAPKVADCATLPAPDPTQYAVVEAPPVPGADGIGLDVFADDVQIAALVVTHAGETGIRTDPAYAGFRLKKTILVENANGLYLHGSGVRRSTVKTNCFLRNDLAGIRTRYGLVDALIAKNRFAETQTAAAIILDNEPPATNTAVTVRSNESQGDSTFLIAVGTVDSLVSKNVVDGTDGTAIFVGGNNVNLELSRNTLTNAGTRGIRFNTTAFGGSASTGVLVSRNTIDRAGVHGIAADSAAGESSLLSSTIEENVVTASGQSGSGDGIRIEDPTAGGANSGNTLRDNTITGSFNHDCHDDTTGGGTAGTGNTWQSQTAATQNRAALCTAGPANGTPD